MSGTEEKKMEEVDEPLFIDGYITQRWKSGEIPNYGYPSNHLPISTGGQMDVVTGILTKHT